VLAAKVDEMFARWDRKDGPGCAVGIIQNGQLVYSKGFGSANLDDQVPNTPQTVFEVASFSKSITCVCLALLMDQGKVSPEDDIRKFVPEMHPFDSPIRVQDLVRCRSGLWDQLHIAVLVGWDNVPLQSPYTAEDTLAIASGQKHLPFKPGTQFQYGSGDYFLLGLIVQRVSGLSLADFARKNVFQPLGMTRTFFEEDPTRVVEHRAVGHYKHTDGTWRQWRPTAYLPGGGGLKTCVGDLYRWDQNFYKNLLPKGKYIDEFIRGGTLLGNRYVLDLDAYRIEVNPKAPGAGPPGQYRGLKRTQFTGGAWGIHAAMAQFPEQKWTVMCLSNCDDILPWTITRRIADLYLADHLKPEPPGAEGRKTKDEPIIDLPAADLRDKVGAYRMKGAGVFWQISLREGALQLTDHLQGTFPLRPLSASRFRPVGPSRFYTSTVFVFSRPTVDPPSLLTLEWDEPGNPGSVEFERVVLVEPTVDELRCYAGEYESVELSATYRFTVRDGHLWLRVNSRRWERLDPTTRDQFIPHGPQPHGHRIITFLRNDKSEVSGLSVAYGRVKGVQFGKR
jgi:CubicO group peptidase (beta-lactamase class C family)